MLLARNGNDLEPPCMAARLFGGFLSEIETRNAEGLPPVGYLFAFETGGPSRTLYDQKQKT